MNSAYNRISRQNRPKVAKRLDPLNDTNQQKQQLENTSSTEETSPSTEISETSEANVASANKDIQISSEPLVLNANDINSTYLQFKTVSASWRIHPEVKKAIDSLIQENNSADTVKITKDTFVEAAIVVCQQNPQILQSVLEEARIRQSFRNKVGAYKRSISTMQKLNSQPDQNSSV